jgi:hypothetical protein
VFSGEQAKFIQISVKECSQRVLDQKYNYTKRCKNESEVIRVAGHLKLYLVVQNSYFKDEEFDGNPIKKFLKPYILTSSFNTSNYQYMLVSENNVTMHNNKFFGKPVQDSFIETRVDYTAVSSIPDDDGGKTAFIGIYLQMDD